MVSERPREMGGRELKNSKTKKLFDEKLRRSNGEWFLRFEAERMMEFILNFNFSIQEE